MTEKPKPIYFAREEGGELEPFKSPNGAVHAIWFADGSQFDTVNGWRKPNPWLKPRVRVLMGRAIV